MAIYKYRCKNCGDFIIEVKMKDYKRIESCPTCGNNAERVIGKPSALIFKGEGFYVNDYKKKTAKTGGDSGENS